jgi:hypothetical protein
MTTRVVLLLIVILKLNPSVCQNVPSPKFDFSGTKISWFKQAKDRGKYSDLNVLLSQELLEQAVPHKIVKDRVYYLLEDIAQFMKGATFICLNLETGDSIWMRSFNPLFDERQYSYTYKFNYLENIGDTIEMIGNAVIDTMLVPGTQNYSIPSFGHRRFILNKDGSDISNTVYNVPLKLAVINTPLIKYGKSKFPYSYGYYTNNNYVIPATGEQGMNMVPFSLTEDMEPIKSKDSSKYIIYKEYDVLGHSTYGPYKINEDNYGMFFRFDKSIGGVISRKHFYCKLALDGTIKAFKDISPITNSNFIETYFTRYEYVAERGYFRLYSINPFNKDRGLIYLDEDGNLSRNQESIIIDNKSVSYLISKDLPKGQGIVHVLRFQGEKDINIYKESNNVFTKLGFLKQNDRYLYDYSPTYLEFSEKNDAVITFSVNIDSIISGLPPLNFGGFQFMCKIDAKELGLSTSISDPLIDANVFQLYPNPASSHLVISTKHHGEIEIYNLSAQKLKQQSIQKNRDRIDLSQFPSGMYILKMKAENGQIQAEKFVVEKRE